MDTACARPGYGLAQDASYGNSGRQRVKYKFQLFRKS